MERRKNMKKRIIKTFFNILVLMVLIASGSLLIHDFFIWGIKPLFTGHFILLTYFGFFTDMFAFGTFYLCKEYFKELFK